MAAWILDASEYQMDATGVVKPRMQFSQDAEGKWKNTNVQETHPISKEPLWEVGVSWLSADRYGEPEEMSYSVLVASRTAPNVGRHETVQFEGLQLDYYFHRATNTIRENLTATGIVEAD